VVDLSVTDLIEEIIGRVLVQKLEFMTVFEKPSSAHVILRLYGNIEQSYFIRLCLEVCRSF